MDHFNIKTTEMRAVAFTSAPMKERGIWLTLMLHCVATENPVIESCRNWPEKNWLSVLGVSKADVIKGGSMWEWVNDDLIVWNFPQHHVMALEVKRSQGHHGKDGGRPKKENPDGFPTRVSHDDTHAETLKDKVIEREDKGKGREGAPSHRPDSSSISSTEHEPEKKGERGAPANVDEALAYAASYSKGNGEMLVIDDRWVRDWHNERESVGWLKVSGGVQVPITDWKADLLRWCRRDAKYPPVTVTPKKETALTVVPVAPAGYEAAMAWLWGEEWPDIMPAWANMLPSDQRQVREWLAKQGKEAA